MQELAKMILVVARSFMARELDERDNLEREFKQLLRSGESASFLYTKKDGSRKRRDIIPESLFKMKGRWAVKGPEVGDTRSKIWYLDMIGKNPPGAQVQEAQPEPKKRLSPNDMLDQLHEVFPILKDYWPKMPGGKGKNRVIAIWVAMNSGKALKYDIPIFSERHVLEGPFGAMENTHMEEMKIYISIRGGDPWDKNRVSFPQKIKDYWIDDEGNVSSRPSGYGGGYGSGYRRRRRW